MWKTDFEFIWKTWNISQWNGTGYEILPMFARFLWPLKFIFSSSYWKLFLVLFQGLIHTLMYSELKLLENAKKD